MKQGANWIAWSMQFIVGAVVGAVIGLVIISRRFRLGGSLWLESEQISTFIWGAALIGAGLGSLVGDRLWMGSSHSAIPPDQPEHSNSSGFISIVTALVGCSLVVVAMLRHFGLF